MYFAKEEMRCKKYSPRYMTVECRICIYTSVIVVVLRVQNVTIRIHFMHQNVTLYALSQTLVIISVENSRLTCNYTKLGTDDY